MQVDFEGAGGGVGSSLELAPQDGKTNRSAEKVVHIPSIPRLPTFWETLVNPTVNAYNFLHLLYLSC